MHHYTYHYTHHYTHRWSAFSSSTRKGKDIITETGGPSGRHWKLQNRPNHCILVKGSEVG